MFTFYRDTPILISGTQLKQVKMIFDFLYFDCKLHVSNNSVNSKKYVYNSIQYLFLILLSCFRVVVKKCLSRIKFKTNKATYIRLHQYFFPWHALRIQNEVTFQNIQYALTTKNFVFNDC